MELLKLKKHYMTVGRGASGIYLILKARFQGKRILLPSNICYAAIYPVLYSGNIPVFCDVDPDSGNVRAFDVQTRIDEVSAAVIPHMYGNPVADIAEIRELCTQKHVLLIEDCASSMGADTPCGMTGSFGDFVVYSTGYSKTVDLSNGGLICSDLSLEKEKELSLSLPLYSKEVEKKAQVFSNSYRTFRNSRKDIRDSGFRTLVESDLKEMFLYRNTEEFDSFMLSKLSELDSVIEKRRAQNDLYDALLDVSSGVFEIYPFLPGSVPWRKNIFVRDAYRDRLVRALLDEHIPVSDWYPRTSYLFSDYESYAGAQAHEKRILNFPLMIPEDEIKRICERVNRISKNL